MRKVLTIFFLSLICTTLAAQKVTFMPQWTAQAQFAGFYVAKEKGFYEDEGLDVTIKHIGNTSTETVMDQLLSGKVDIAEQQLLPSMIERSEGAKLVNVWQLTQVCALCAVAKKPLSTPEDLEGMTIGRWTTAYIELADVLQIINGINAKWVSAFNPVTLFMYGAIDATLCTSYHELNSILLKKGNIPEENILRFSEFGFNSPEDGLYVTEKYYKRNKPAIEKFVRASRRGWDYARQNVKEALEITRKYTDEGHVITNDVMQEHMLKEYLKLIVNPDTGVADYAPVKEDVFINLNKLLYDIGYITRHLDYKEMIKCEE
ncbi:MAG: ABC transporter substrate-binding protein [Bacteroidales bacterium]|nr:ABC transporter substrate-binding protein [Candidatus Cryptobacteroides equifaecalis]